MIHELDQGSHVIQFVNTHKSTWKVINIIPQKAQLNSRRLCSPLSLSTNSGTGAGEIRIWTVVLRGLPRCRWQSLESLYSFSRDITCLIKMFMLRSSSTMSIQHVNHQGEEAYQTEVLPFHRIIRTSIDSVTYSPRPNNFKNSRVFSHLVPNPEVCRK